MGKKLIALILAAVSLLLCACGTKQENIPTEQTEPTQLPTVETTAPVVQQPTVGICLPSGSDHWKAQGLLLSQLLEDIGYETIVESAAGDPKVQQNQLLELVEKQVDCIVVAAVDGYGLSTCLTRAKQAGIAVVAYDRLPMYSEVAFCVQPDYYAIGQQLAQYIVKANNPEKKSPKTIEFLMGSADNENSLQFYRGVMEVLQPLLDSRALVCRSKRTGFEDTCVTRESVQAALEQCYEYMREHYSKSRPDILCCAADILAEGCAYALENFQDRVAKNYPMIASVGADAGTVARISAGKQSVGMYIDWTALAKQCVQLTHRYLQGMALPETEKRNNGTGSVLCYSQNAAAVDAENYRLLLDMGVYTQTQLDEELKEENRPEFTLPAATRPGTLPPPPTKAPNTEPTDTTTPTTTEPTDQTETEASSEATEPTQITQPPETEPAQTAPPETVPPQTTAPQPMPTESSTLPIVSI